MLSPLCCLPWSDDDGILILVLILIVLVFLFPPVPARGLPRLVCLFFAHCWLSAISESISIVLPLRAGTVEDAGLYKWKEVEFGGSGPPRNSTITARRTVDMRSAGWYVDAMSESAAERHSRYCMLFAREVGSFMNARAATRAVAAVP
jgi:hypothetical protein